MIYRGHQLRETPTGVDVVRKGKGEHADVPTLGLAMFYVDFTLGALSEAAVSAMLTAGIINETGASPPGEKK